MNSPANSSNSDAGDAEPQPWFVGVDVGGTAIKMGVADRAGKIIHEFQIATEQENGPTKTLERVYDSIHGQVKDDISRIVAAGLGTPGPLDSRTGMILDPVNMPAWRNFPVRDALANLLSAPVSYTNDANAAAYGEYWLGGGRDVPSLVLLTLGTGVGGGIIINDFVIEGANCYGAECGHMIVDFDPQATICSCGRLGHLESYASATAVAKEATTLVNGLSPADGSSLLQNTLRENGSLSARDVYDCASQQDSLALKLIDRTADYLARGIAILSTTIDPSLFLLGGAMDFGGRNTETGQRFLTRIADQVRPVVFDGIGKNLRVEFASLGSAAGWIGAAGIAKRDYDQTA